MTSASNVSDTHSKRCVTRRISETPKASSRHPISRRTKVSTSSITLMNRFFTIVVGTLCVESHRATLQGDRHSHSRRLNVLGFLSRAGKLIYHTTTGSVTTETVIDAFDQFVAQKKPIPSLLWCSTTPACIARRPSGRKYSSGCRTVCIWFTYRPIHRS